MEPPQGGKVSKNMPRRLPHVKRARRTVRALVVKKPGGIISA
jgi:hypothetical protein